MTKLSRRTVLGGLAATGALATLRPSALGQPTGKPLEEFRYDQVRVTGAIQQAQRDNVTSVLLGFDENSLMKPYRAMSGKPDPGPSLGGWYEWKPDYDPHHDDAGLAPGANLGQWISAMARLSASDPERGRELAERATRLTSLLREEITPGYFEKTRFPGYTLDKLVCACNDTHRILHDSIAFQTLDRVMDAAEPSEAGHAVDRDIQWKVGADGTWLWDENYTLPENLLLAADAGAGARYRKVAEAYLDDKTLFAPLARGENALADKHAYSYVNALCSAAQMYLSTGTTMHLEAAMKGFDFVHAQSFSTGGWGPDELLRKPGYDDLFKSLTASHNSFETPCGSYAHAKLTRALLRITRDGRYGDSMERVLLNTVMGALPMQADGRSFYSSDYNTVAKRIYSVHRWPCCSGTLPQVVADYGINGYLHEPGAMWVNLYQNSELRWQDGDSSLMLTQQHEFPAGEKVTLRLTANRPKAFTLKLRVPTWAQQPSMAVNGKAEPLRIDKGFATVQRVWRSGDTVTLTLPMSLRLEALPANGTPHLDTVSLLHGPLVLFALREATETGPLSLRHDELLNAERTGPAEWTVYTPTGLRKFVPFTEVGDRSYTTYITAT